MEERRDSMEFSPEFMEKLAEIFFKDEDVL
jgi:hypothetical protein